MNTEYGVKTADGTIQPIPFGVVAAKHHAYRRDTSGNRIRPGAVVVSRDVSDWTEVPSPSDES